MNSSGVIRAGLVRARLLSAAALIAWTPGAVADDDPPVSPEYIEGTVQVDAEGLIETAEQINDLLLIDARIRDDRREGYIEGSISLPDRETDCDSLAEVIPDTGWPVMFYCNGPKCGRSARSARIAVDCGYTNVYWFRGGVEEWKAKDFPLQH